MQITWRYGAAGAGTGGRTLSRSQNRFMHLPLWRVSLQPPQTLCPDGARQDRHIGNIPVDWIGGTSLRTSRSRPPLTSRPPRENASMATPGRTGFGYWQLSHRQPSTASSSLRPTVNCLSRCSTFSLSACLCSRSSFRLRSSSAFSSSVFFRTNLVMQTCERRRRRKRRKKRSSYGSFGRLGMAWDGSDEYNPPEQGHFVLVLQGSLPLNRWSDNGTPSFAPPEQGDREWRVIE